MGRIDRDTWCSSHGAAPHSESRRLVFSRGTLNVNRLADLFSVTLTGCVTSRLHVDVERIGIFRPSAYNLVISTFVFEHLSHPEQGSIALTVSRPHTHPHNRP